MSNESNRTVYKYGFKTLNQNTNKVNLATYIHDRTEDQVGSQLMQNTLLIVCRRKTSYDHHNRSKQEI